MRRGARTFQTGWARVLLLVVVTAFALLGYRPAAAPVAFETTALFLGIEICHDGSAPDQGHEDKSCVFCHLIAGASDAVVAPGQSARPEGFARLARPRDRVLPHLRPLRIAQARGPPASGSVTA